MKRRRKKTCQIRENGSKQRRKKERKKEENLNLLDCFETNLIKNEIACSSQIETKNIKT
jgi:hypothetical protein